VGWNNNLDVALCGFEHCESTDALHHPVDVPISLFTAPEVVHAKRGFNVGLGKADLYSLGILIHFLLVPS
jgi:hypothetical protein